jgi:Lipase (class 3)
MLSHHDLAVLAGRAYSGRQSAVVALDVRAALLPREEELVVVMPGTHPDDALDWLRDLWAWPGPIAGLGLLHSGFGEGGAALWRRERRNLRERGLISYVGHSLGGALAQVMAAHHALDRPMQPFRIVSFGAPRVAFMANRRFGRLVRSALEAVEYRRAGDLVSDAPPWPLFRHPTAGVRLGSRLADPIANHSIDRYAADLAAAEVDSARQFRQAL